MYKSYILEVPEVGEILDEINTAKETIVGCFYVSDAAQVVIIVEGVKDLMKEKIKNLINPGEI